MSFAERNPAAPIVTVGIVVLNREWIIEKTLTSLQHQTYFHDKIFVVIADGGSKDRTVEKAREILAKSDFTGYQVISRKCSIPEGRNLCIENMRGDALLFWDSDVIMSSRAIEDLVEIMIREKADIVSAKCISISLRSIEEADVKINAALTQHEAPLEKRSTNVPAATMGQTLISKTVVESMRFDPDLTYREDVDFSVRAREKGFTILLAEHVITFDVNIWRKGGSDIYIEMPLKNSLRGLRKKVKVQVLAYAFELTPRSVARFLLKHVRYLFYVGYIPALVLTVYGLLESTYLLFVFPIYLSLFAVWQIERRGLRQGLRSVLRSLVIGVPSSLWLIYYLAKYSVRKTR